MPLSSAASYYRNQQSLAALAVRAARKADGVAGKAAQLIAYQVAAAKLADISAGAMLEEQDLDPTPVGNLNPAAFATDSRGAAAMIQAAATDEAIDQVVSTLVADSGRSGMGAATVARPSTNGHVRYLTSPSCARCAVLAGRFYRWSTGFQRHPRCDCQMVPTNSTVADDLISDPEIAFERGEIRGLSRADTEALREGADLSRVVNVHARAAGLSPSTSSLTRGGRLTPDGIYRLAGDDRDEAVRLLREQGYLTTTAAPRRASTVSASTARIDGDLSALGEPAATEVAQRWHDLTTRYPQIPGTLRVTTQKSSRSGVTSGRAVALRTDDGFEIGGIELSPRIGLESAERAFQTAVANGWFTPAPSNVAHTLAHEFGHLVDYFTEMKVSVGRAQRRAWKAAGIEPGSDVDLFLRRNTSGYARTERAEAVAEAFADVELNGDAASPVNRAIYDDLMRLLERRIAELS